MIDFWGRQQNIARPRYVSQTRKTAATFLSLDPGMIPSAAVYAVKTTQTFGVWEKLQSANNCGGLGASASSPGGIGPSGIEPYSAPKE